MHPIPPSSVTVTVAVTLLLLLTTSFSSPDADGNSAVTFPGCNQTFHCGPLRNLSYPFSGGSRPSHCGLPAFRLACSDSSAEIAIGLLTSRVLRVDPPSRTMAVARSDLWNQPCPSEFTNTTLGSGPFSYGAGNAELTMFYRCNVSVLNVTPENQFRCDAYNFASNDSYFLIGPIPFDPILKVAHCSDSVRVPIQQTIAAPLTHNKSLLGQALMEGFNVNFTVPFADKCSKCVDYGGHCGFDSNLKKAICICGDRVCSVPGSSSKGNWIIGIAAGVTAGIVVLSIIFICFYRRQCKLSKAITFSRRDKIAEFDVETFLRNYGSLSPNRYSYADMKKITNSFAEKIGTGGYGAVYKGKLSNGCLVAVKMLKECNSNGEEFMNEVASIGRTSHVNVVTLLGFCYERKKRALVYEYMPNGSLDKFIFNQESSIIDSHLEWKTLFDIAVGVAQGLEYLHRGCNTTILHFDIKPHNILLDKDLCPKISDFGLAKLWLKKEVTVSMVGARGTVGYMAPEVFSRAYGRVSNKSDVYSYGMLVLEMVGGRKNYDSGVSHTSEIYYPNSIYKDIEMGNKLSILTHGTEEEKEFSMKMCLVSFWCIQTNPSDRPSMSKVVDMLEGSLQSIEVPPKPFLFSPTRSLKQSPTPSL